MEPDRQRWVDSPEFDWTPDAPLRFDADTRREPWFGPPRDMHPANDPLPHAANANRAWLVLFPRLLLGLLQGLALMALFQSRDLNQAPGNDPAWFAALTMALMFAPLLLIQGLGRARLKPLLLWTVFGVATLGGLGFYHHWRVTGADPGHAGLWLAAMAAIFFFIGQALLLGTSRPSSDLMRYAVLQESACQLAIQFVLCALAGFAAWALWGAAEGWLRIKYPALPLGLITTPLVTVSLALAAQCCGVAVLRPLEQGLKFSLTLLLPIAILLATFTVLVGGFARWQPPLGLLIAELFLLILTLNASYRGGEWRVLWRRRCEFIGAFLLAPLVVLAGLSLALRVTEYGFTAPRIAALALLMLAGAYALSYIGAALISLGGGPWMARLESANVLMAFVALSLIATLASPLADPVHLSVLSQNWRLAHAKVTPDAFDYAYLRNDGLSFGHDDLIRMARQKDSPMVARGAFLALAADPAADQASPTEIGANIRVMTPGARLPTNLLRRDWTKAGPGVPPCLTSARLSCDAYFVDLDGDGDPQIMLTYGDDSAWWAAVLRQGVGGGWYMAGTVASPPCPGSLSALRAGQFVTADPLPGWRDLVVQGEHLAVSLIAHSRPACK